MHGQVKVWYMSEEERLSYIAKHPIKQDEKPKGAIFSTDAIDYKAVNESRKETIRKQGVRLIDDVDTDALYKLFKSGVKLNDIAQTLGITNATLNNYIKEQRKKYPEKWRAGNLEGGENMIEHPMVTQINRTGYPREMEEKPQHFGIDAMGNKILIGDSIVVDEENGEIILEDNLEDYLIEKRGFRFMKAE